MIRPKRKLPASGQQIGATILESNSNRFPFCSSGQRNRSIHAISYRQLQLSIGFRKSAHRSMGRKWSPGAYREITGQ